MLLNDSIYLLDESLQKLNEIHNTEREFLTPEFAARPNVRP